jgi:hypothetical protein
MDINIFRDPDSEIFDTDISYFYFKLSWKTENTKSIYYIPNNYKWTFNIKED